MNNSRSSHDEIIEKLKSLQDAVEKLKGSEPKDFEEWFRKNSGYQIYPLILKLSRKQMPDRHSFAGDSEISS